MDIEVYKNYFCIGIRDYVTKELIFGVKILMDF